jgi:hypothetical protein
MRVCCPVCEQPLPIRWVLFNHKTPCPHCQVKLKENWWRWGIIQLMGLMFVLMAYVPIHHWHEQIYRVILIVLSTWTLFIVVPGQFRVLETGEEER